LSGLIPAQKRKIKFIYGRISIYFLASLQPDVFLCHKAILGCCSPGKTLKNEGAMFEFFLSLSLILLPLSQLLPKTPAQKKGPAQTECRPFDPN
jgi:hypothetical protein